MSETRGIAMTLRGLGLWTPGYPDALSWSQRHVRGDRSNEPARSAPPGGDAPRAELLPPMLRRRTSLLTRMAAEVAAQAIASAGFDRAEVTMIYGSVYGEIRTTLDLLAALQDPAAPLSPTKFHNSVHNTAAGYVSIATQNRRGNAALTAGRSTLAMGLVECAGLIAAGQGPVVLVIAEETLPEPLAAGRSYAPLAAAFALDAAGTGAVGAVPGDMSSRTCRLVQVNRGDPAAPVSGVSGLPAALAGNPCALALALCELALLPGAACLSLEPHLPAGGWCIELDGSERGGGRASEFPPVQELVPQRPPMLLLDAVTAWDGATLECVATVRADWLLVEAGRMPAAGLLEVMAQAVAAMHGLQGHARGEPVRVGLLTGCRELRLHAPAVPVGTSLRVRARQVVDLEAAAEFECSVVTADGRALAEGALQVVRGEPTAATAATSSTAPEEAQST